MLTAISFTSGVEYRDIKFAIGVLLFIALMVGVFAFPSMVASAAVGALVVVGKVIAVLAGTVAALGVVVL